MGLALANCLVRSPHISSLALIDRKLPQSMVSPHPIPNQRVYALNSPTLQLLGKLGAWQRVRQFGELTHIEVVSKEAGAFVEWAESAAKVA